MHIKSDHTQVVRWATFAEVAFPAELKDILCNGDVASFVKPTLIQQFVWPASMRKEDIIGVAKTGSGKTLAFLLPAFIHVKLQESKGVVTDQGHGPLCVVIAPTRELCQQIYDEARKFGMPAGIETAVAYGGQNRREQLGAFHYQSPQIAVCCPGRFKDFVEAGDVSVQNVDYVVLDEADRMLDMGFEQDIRAILSHFQEDRQSMLFSATFPDEVKVLARKMCYGDALHIQIGSSDSLTGNSDIDQEVRFVNRDSEKANLIYQEVSENWDAEAGWWKTGDFKYLVFLNTKRECAQMASDFTKWGVKSCELHGDLDQRRREKSLEQFKDGTCKLLFATDVASRGLDVKGISAVFNYSPPNTVGITCTGSGAPAARARGARRSPFCSPPRSTKFATSCT